MPILNYTTKIPAEQTAAEIMSILVKKGATDILTHYGPGGMATGLKWRMIEEWILAQMVLVETEMVSVEEVFMPYMLTGKQTLY